MSEIHNLVEIDGKIFKLYSEKLKEIIIPSEDKINEVLREIHEIKKYVNEIDKLMSDDDVKNKVWIQHLIELLNCWEIGISENLRHPSKYLRGIGFRIFKVIEDEKKSIAEKAEEISRKTEKILELLPAVHQLCFKVDDKKIERVIRCMKGLLVDMEKYGKIIQDISSREENEENKRYYISILENIARIMESIKQIMPEVQKIVGMKREILEDIPYEVLLERYYGIPIKWVLSWYMDELEKAKMKFRELAARLDPTKDPLTVLKERIHIPYSTPEEMFRAMETFLEIAKKYAKEYIDFPDEVTCKVVGVKEFEKDIYPMGHAGGPDPLEGGLESYVALNQYNYKAFSKGWLMMMAIHEAYYGHNIHSIKIGLAEIPKTFKISSGLATPISEGLAHRGEELLQHIYSDEAFPLLVVWRRVQTTLRIYIDIGLFYKKNLTPEDAVKLYMEVMGFDEQTSRGLVEWHLENRGYNVCYFTGYKMIEELRKHIDISEKEFSNTLFSAGFTSINNIKRILKIKDKMPWE